MKTTPAPCIASFCPICHDVQPFYLSRAGGTGGTTAVIGTCEDCGLRATIDPQEFLEVCPERPATVRELMERTAPRLPLDVAGRVWFEKRAAAGEVEAPERAAALREPFQVLAYLTNDAPMTLPTVAIAGVCGVAGMIASMFAMDGLGYGPLLDGPGAGSGTLKGVLLAVPAGIAAGVCVWRGVRARRRRVERELLPRLARALRPLRPTVEELGRTFDWLHAAAHPAARLVTPASVHAAMSSLPDRSLVNADEMDLLGLAREMHERLTEAARRGV